MAKILFYVICTKILRIFSQLLSLPINMNKVVLFEKSGIFLNKILIVLIYLIFILVIFNSLQVPGLGITVNISLLSDKFFDKVL